MLSALRAGQRLWAQKSDMLSALVIVVLYSVPFIFTVLWRDSAATVTRARCLYLACQVPKSYFVGEFEKKYHDPLSKSWMTNNVCPTVSYDRRTYYDQILISYVNSWFGKDFVMIPMMSMPISAQCAFKTLFLKCCMVMLVQCRQIVGSATFPLKFIDLNFTYSLASNTQDMSKFRDFNVIDISKLCVYNSCIINFSLRVFGSSRILFHPPSQCWSQEK